MAITLLRRAAGRSSEVAWVTWDGIKWDPLFQTPIIEIAQTKVSKMKLIALVAGRDRHSDFLLNMADFLVRNGTGPPYLADSPAWLFPDLQAMKSPGEKMGRYVKDLRPGGAREYASHPAKLPDAPTAGGIRPGALNELEVEMPAEFVAHTSGHSFDIGSLYVYLDASVAKCMPGATVLAGWPGFPWGQLARGPSPPTLIALEHLGVSLSSLDSLMDVLFGIDGTSPPMLHIDGSLRPMIHASFATLVMYFEVCSRLGEMRAVNQQLLLLLQRANPGVDAQALLIKWGAEIARQFKADNLRLLHKEHSEGVTYVAQVVTELGELISKLAERTRAVEDKLDLLSQAQQLPAVELPSQSPAPAPAARTAPAQTAARPCVLVGPASAPTVIPQSA